MFLITRLFTAGPLKGLQFTELTSVRMTIGREYRSCVVRSERYIITKVVPAAPVEIWSQK